jgi:leader peptidase (prepilin peptidase)/N-methyltransferase
MDIQNIIYLLLFTIYGMIFGSFATALIYRMPRDIDWVLERSKCIKCNTLLSARDLFPIFSWVFSKGKCRHCKTSFGGNYLVTELLVTASFVALYLIKGFSAETAILCLLTFAIIVLSVIDFEHYIIPDEVNIFIFFLGCWWQYLNQASWQQFIVMPLAMFAFAMFLRWFMYLLKKREGLGLGDVKFFIAAGVFLTAQNFSIFLFLSGIVGILIALLWKLLKKGDLFPFGPALSISLLLCVIFPQIGDYLNNFIIKTFYQ